MLNGSLSPFVEAIPDPLLERKSSALLRSAAAFVASRSREGAPDSYGSLDDESSYNQDAARLVKGERVAHPKFGSGVIAEISGFGPDTKVTVDFDSVGRKKLIARYAGLERDYDL
jgi:DNA helicase-2/ATP-dependent DNA helicase PcrA